MNPYIGPLKPTISAKEVSFDRANRLKFNAESDRIRKLISDANKSLAVQFDTNCLHFGMKAFGNVIRNKTMKKKKSSTKKGC